MSIIEMPPIEFSKIAHKKYEELRLEKLEREHDIIIDKIAEKITIIREHLLMKAQHGIFEIDYHIVRDKHLTTDMFNEVVKGIISHFKDSGFYFKVDKSIITNGTVIKFDLHMNRLTNELGVG